MSKSVFSRRRFVTATAGMGIAALVPHDAIAQQPRPVVRIAPETAGALHRSALDEIARALGGAPLESKDGLSKILGLLQRQELINGFDAGMLAKLIDALFRLKSIEELQKAIEDIYTQLVGKAGEIALAIVSIARDSVAYAKTLLQKLAQSRAIDIVVADVSGGLNAAVLGKTFGTSMAVIFAIGGAVYGSAKQAYGTK